jgi:hypothetical protein
MVCAGPGYYIENRFILNDSVPSLERWLQPTDWMASRSRLYYDYLNWWAREGRHRAAEECADANKHLQATPR